ncbi:MAG: hypothetical protein IT449_14105 [Phycisphaerales bacterium]|nr:hypothetical protein [Phycisphaerales bacterium]
MAWVVAPAQSGAQGTPSTGWIPARAGMTDWIRACAEMTAESSGGTTVAVERDASEQEGTGS